METVTRPVVARDSWKNGGGEDRSAVLNSRCVGYFAGEIIRCDPAMADG